MFVLIFDFFLSSGRLYLAWRIFCSVGRVSWKGAPLFGLDGNVPLSRAWFSGSWTRILYKNVKDRYKKCTFVIPTIFDRKIQSQDVSLKNFLLLYVKTERMRVLMYGLFS